MICVSMCESGSQTVAVSAKDTTVGVGAVVFVTFPVLSLDAKRVFWYNVDINLLRILKIQLFAVFFFVFIVISLNINCAFVLLLFF